MNKYIVQKRRARRQYDVTLMFDQAEKREKEKTRKKADAGSLF